MRLIDERTGIEVIERTECVDLLALRPTRGGSRWSTPGIR